MTTKTDTLAHRRYDCTTSQNNHIRLLPQHIFEYLVKHKDTTNWKKKIKKYHLSQEQLEYIVQTVEYLLAPDDIHKLITNKSVNMEWLNKYRPFISKTMWTETIPIFADYNTEFLMKNKQRMDPYTVITCKTFPSDTLLKTYVDAIIKTRSTEYPIIRQLFKGLALRYPLSISFIKEYKDYFAGSCEDNHPTLNLKNTFYDMIHNPYLSTDVINHYAPEIKQSLHWDMRNLRTYPNGNPHHVLNIIRYHNINKIMDNYYDILSCYFEIALMYQAIDEKHITRYINEFNLTDPATTDTTWNEIIDMAIYFKPQSEITAKLLQRYNEYNLTLKEFKGHITSSLNLSPGLYALNTNYVDYFNGIRWRSRTLPLFWYVYSSQHLSLHKYPKEAEQLTAKYKRNVIWSIVSEIQTISEEFIEEHLEHIDINTLMMNENTIVSKKFLYKHREKINSHNLEWYLRTNKYFKWIMFQRKITERIYTPRNMQSQSSTLVDNLCEKYKNIMQK